MDANEHGLQFDLLLLLPLLHREVQLIEIYVHVTSTCGQRESREVEKVLEAVLCTHVFSTHLLPLTEYSDRTRVVLQHSLCSDRASLRA